MRATFPELWMDVNIHNVDLVTTGREERAGWVITVSSTEHLRIGRIVHMPDMINCFRDLWISKS